MSMKKLFAIDLDGTIFDREKNVTPRTIDAIKAVQDAGHEVVLCTGRCPCWVRHKFANTSVRYVIGSNGAQIYDIAADKLLYCQTMDTEAVLDVWRNSHNVPGIMYQIACPEAIYASHQSAIALFDGADLVDTDMENFIRTHNITQFNPVSVNPQTMQGVIDDLIAKNIIEGTSKISMPYIALWLVDPTIPVGGYTTCDLNPSNTSKGMGLTRFANILNIPMQNTVAVGDSLNDLSMFDVAGYKVAMGNSLKQIKDVADLIIATNNEDGVAKYLEQFV